MNFSRASSHSLAGKLLRIPLRLIPRNACIPILQGPLRGRRWIAGSSDHGCWLGSYEYEKQKAFEQAVRLGDVVYDLGANAGFYSLMASVLVGSVGRVLAFEPDPGNTSMLRKHLELNQITNCSVFEAAVTCSSGYGDFVAGPTYSTGHLGQRSERTTRVRTIRLDDLINTAQLPPPNIIKCDIEGSEYDALRGAAEILRRYAPVIFLATHGARVHALCCKFLQGFGYRLSPIDGVSLADTAEILARPGSAQHCVR